MISKNRFEAFSDGVFAIAITLLVLEFQVPSLTVGDEAGTLHALLSLWPQYLVYAASFITIGIMWFNHYSIFHRVERVSYATLIANLALLLLVAFLPFPTEVLARAGFVPSSVIFYGLVFVGLSIAFGALQYVAGLREGQHGSLAGYLRARTPWNSVGIILYSLGLLIALASPLATIVLYAAVAVYYLLPFNLRAASASPPAD